MDLAEAEHDAGAAEVEVVVVAGLAEVAVVVNAALLEPLIEAPVSLPSPLDMMPMSLSWIVQWRMVTWLAPLIRTPAPLWLSLWAAVNSNPSTRSRPRRD